MRRLHQILLLGAFLPLCWLLMMAVHELGHVSAAAVSGGTVERVVLYPLTISRTDLSLNPHPLLVALAGPLLGALLPLGLLALVRAAGMSWAYLARFFAGFCLVANAGYIGGGSFSRAGDAGDMLRYGSAIWCLWLFGLLTLPLGIFLWHGLGPKFGLGPAAGRVDPRAAYLACGLLAATLTLELLLSPR